MHLGVLRNLAKEAAEEGAAAAAGAPVCELDVCALGARRMPGPAAGE